jgi:hypothetical protein
LNIHSRLWSAEHGDVCDHENAYNPMFRELRVHTDTVNVFMENTAIYTYR